MLFFVANKIIDKKLNAFWVCPLIDESEKLDLTAATNRFEKLKKLLLKKKLKNVKNLIIQNQFIYLI